MSFFFLSDINASLANVVGAHATVDLVVGIRRACLVRLVLSLGAIAKLAVQLHHTLHTLNWSNVLTDDAEREGRNLTTQTG